MSRFLDVRQDDELFAARLQEVNKEMDTLLHKTSRTRHEMDRTAAEVRMGVPLNFYPHEGRAVGDAVHGSSSFHQTTAMGDGAISNAARDDLTRAVVSAELTQWVHTHLPKLVEPLVETQVQRRLQQLRESVEEVQARQAEVEESAKEAASQLRAHRRDMQAGLSAMRRGVQQDIEEHQRRIEAQLGAWKEEVQRVKDEMRALQSQSHGETERAERRLQDALQQQQQQAQHTLATLDRDFHRWRQSVQSDVEKDAHMLQMQHSEVEGHVGQLQGALASTTSVATHCAVELQRLMEDAVSRASEVRRCRGDVNRLEMLVQCAALHTAAARVPTTAASTTKRSANTKSRKEDAAECVDGNDVPALQSVVALSHDVAHMHDMLLAVVSRVDGLDRQVRVLDMTLARGAATAVTPRGFLHDLTRDIGDDGLPHHRSGTSTRRPSNSQLSSLYTGRSTVPASRAAPSFVSSAHTHADHEGGGGGSSSGMQQHLSEGVVPMAQQQQQQQQQRSLPSAVGLTSPPSFAGGGSLSSARGESRLFRAAPDPSAALARSPTSHLSSSRLPFEDYAEDPQPMPIVVRDSRAAPATMSGGLVGSRLGGGREGSLPQRRAPLRVIPVETVPAPATVEKSPTAAAAAAPRTTPPSLTGQSTPMAVMHSGSDAEDDAASGRDNSSGTPHEGSRKDVGALNESPSAFSLERYGDMRAASNSNSNSSTPVREAAGTEASPADSYVSDTPAGAAASEDSYVSDTPGADHAPTSSADRFGRYTPAPASDSEDERDNLVISRSALD